MDKIKAFFANPITRIVCSVLFCLGTVGLFIGGITQEEMNGVLVAVVALVSLLGGLIVGIGKLIHKK